MQINIFLTYITFGAGDSAPPSKLNNNHKEEMFETENPQTIGVCKGISRDI